MKKLNKLGLLTSTALLSMALLVSCSSKEEEEEVLPPVDNNIVESQDVEEESPEAEEDSEALEEDSEPEETEEESEEAEEDESEEPEEDAESTETVTPAKLSTSDFTLGSVGATTKISVQQGQDVKDVTYSSDNDAVAKVGSDGTVTAVANGTAKITVKFTSEGKSQTLTATVRCNIAEANTEPEVETPAPAPEAETPAPAPEPAPTPEPEPEPQAPASADLSAFYSRMTSSHTFGDMVRMDNNYLNAFYPGLTSVSMEQTVVYMASIATSAIEIGLVEVTNSSDVNTVKNIFQTRVSSQVAGGAFYPASIEAWQNQASVVTKGNYVMIVVHPNHSSIVSSFQGL